MEGGKRESWGRREKEKLAGGRGFNPTFSFSRRGIFPAGLLPLAPCRKNSRLSDPNDLVKSHETRSQFLRNASRCPSAQNKIFKARKESGSVAESSMQMCTPVYEKDLRDPGNGESQAHCRVAKGLLTRRGRLGALRFIRPTEIVIRCGASEVASPLVTPLILATRSIANRTPCMETRPLKTEPMFPLTPHKTSRFYIPRRISANISTAGAQSLGCPPDGPRPSFSRGGMIVRAVPRSE